MHSLGGCCVVKAIESGVLQPTSVGVVKYRYVNRMWPRTPPHYDGVHKDYKQIEVVFWKP